ncbi:MAG: type 1 glutamine amidotransferase domain-containing protein, partial [Thermoleophilia bacterium]|nr:type 1 glutamine amidotransferase domain-containing protein [Thermoleophilia bacterium]
MTKVLIAVTNIGRMGDTNEPTGFQLSEVTHPLKELEDAGFTVDFVSPQGGLAPITVDEGVDPLNDEFLDDPARMKQVAETLAPDDVHVHDYDAIFFAGGHGAMWDFPESDELARIAASIYERGGVVGAVCHGPAGLLPVRLSDGTPLVQGKRVSAFTNAEEQAVGKTDIVPFLLADALERCG